MSEITEFILTKYYGFGANPENKKFVSSHEANYDPSKFSRISDSNDSETNETTVQTSGRGTSGETVKDEVEDSKVGDSVDFRIIRSSRAILDENALENDDTSVMNDLEALLEPPQRKDQSHGEAGKIPDGKIVPTSKKVEINDEVEETSRNNSTLEYFDDILSDNISDVSSVPVKKKRKKKSALTVPSMISSQPPPPPKKLPPCNGVFLDLTNLCLTEFPVHMLGTTPNLRMLYLENNSLTELPEELFSSLRLLQWLDVRNNYLETLPESVKFHPCLETILLEGNLFEKLPLELCLVPNLKELQTSRNPLIFPPADILALGFAATMNFLRCEWNKTHPDEFVETPERDNKPRPATILCSDPPISRTSSKSSRLFGCSSTGHVSQGTSKISVREKTKNYRPSNRCASSGTDEELDTRLLWIAKVKEMLIEQAVALQKIKDREAMSIWRSDRRSYEKSLSRAANRTEEDIPFGIDVEDFAAIFKNRLKMPVGGASKSKKRGPIPPRDIDEKMMELYESLNQLHDARKSSTLTPRTEQKLLEKQIKKLTELQDEIQNLKRYNETSTAQFKDSALLPQIEPYIPTPSIII